MGKEVDQRVVEMRFDNKQFEDNVKTTMSTLDKLKKALHLDGASKGLENVGSAAKKVDMSGLSNAAETVRVKFSALEVIGVTALTNITNSAINAGKQLVKSLSVDQIMSGYSKYEQETANVQTLMNSTGKSVDEVNAYLEKLMWFSDETSYGFTDMTTALATMVSSGGDIEKLIPMIEGIATATAFAGKGANEFSRVIYNLNQSYGQGALTLGDWRSVELAGASSTQLKKLIIDTAGELGKLKKIQGKYFVETKSGLDEVNTGTFASTLKEKWADTAVMEKAFGKFSEYAVAVQNAVEAGQYESTAEAMEALAGKYDKLAVEAFEAAQNAKSFGEAVDATKDAVSSEWKKIFKVIFGDFEQARELWTDICNDLWDIFVPPVQAITKLMKGTMFSGWDKIKEQVTKAGVPIEDFKSKLIALGKKNGVVTDKMIEEAGSFEKSLKSGWLSGKMVSDALKSYTGMAKQASKATQNFEKVVKQVIRGDFGNGAARVKALTAAGYDYKTIQDMVNKTVWGQKVSYEVLSNAQLKNIGFTEEQIKAIRELAAEAEKTGTPLEELIASMEKPSGRELLIDTIRNVLNGIKGIVMATGEAMGMISSSTLYAFLERMNELSKKLILVDSETEELNEKGKKLVRTFKGIKAAMDIVRKLIKGAFKVALNLVSRLLGMVDVDVLDVTASVGDAIVAFKEWIDEHNVLGNAIDKVSRFLGPIASKIKDLTVKTYNLIKEFFELPKVQNAITKCKNVCISFGKEAGKWLTSLGKRVSEVFGKLKNYVFSFLKGKKKVDDSIDVSVGQFKKVELTLNQAGKSITKFKFGTAKDLKDAGGSFTSFCSGAWKALSNFKDKIAKNFGFGEIFTIVVGASLIVAIKKIFSFLDVLKTPLKSTAQLLNGLTNGVEGFFDALIKSKNAEAFKSRSEGILNFAKAIGILAIALFAFTKVDFNNLEKSAKILGALIAVVLVVYGAMALISKWAGASPGQLPIVSLVTSLATLITALKSMEDLDPKKAKNNVHIIGVFMVALAGVAIALSKLAPELKNGALVFLGIALAIKILVGSLKTLNDMNPDKTLRSLAIIKSLFFSIASILWLSNGQSGKAGAGILAMAASILLIIIAIKAIARISGEDLIKGLGVIFVVFSMFVGLMAATRLAGAAADKGGKSILAMSTSLMLIAIAVKIIANIDGKDLAKATVVISILMAVMSGCIALMSLGGGGSFEKVGITMLAIASSIILLTLAIVALSHIDGEGLARATLAIVALEAMMAVLIAVSKMAQDNMKTIVALTVAVGVLALSLIALSSLDSEKLLGATTALTIVMLSFVALLAVTSIVKPAGILTTIITMTVIMGLIAGMLILMNKMGVEASIDTAKAISILMLSLSAVCLVLSIVGMMGPAGIVGVEVLFVLMLAIVALIKIMPKEVGFTLETVDIITKLLLGLSAVCLILSVVGLMGPAGLVGVGVLSVLMIAISALIKKMPTEVGFTLETVDVMTKLLLGLSAICVVLGVVGAVGLAAIAGVGVLSTIMASIIGICALISKFPKGKLEEFLNSGIPILEKIAYAIGSVVGNIIKGFASSVLDIIPLIGVKLSLFWVTIQPFLSGVKSIKKDTVDGVKKLVEIMLLMAAIEIVQSITSFMSFLSGGNPLIKFATELLLLTPIMVKFAKKMGELSKKELSAMSMSSTAIKYLCEAANAIPKRGGLMSKIAGENSLTGFAKELNKFAPKLIDYAKKVKALTDADVKNIERASSAIEEICKAANKVPKHGGWLQAITGDNSLVAFATELDKLAPALVGYATEILKMPKGGYKAIEESMGTLTKICEAANKVPKHGGKIKEWITGDNTLVMFAAELDALAPALVRYASTLLGIGEGVSGMPAGGYEEIEKSVTYIAKLCDAANKVPKYGGKIKEWFTGNNSFKKFVEELDSLAPGLCRYAQTLVDKMPANGFAIVSASITHVGSLVEIANDIPTDSKKTITLGEFGKQIKTLSSAFMTFYNNVKKVDGKKMDSAIKQVNKLLTLAKDTSGLDAKKFSGFGEALKIVGESGVSKFVKSFTDAKKKVEDAAVKMAGYATAKLNTQKEKDKFAAAGKYLVAGFVGGINSSSTSLSKASINLAETTCDAIKKALKIASPSKVTYGLGEFTGQGFVNAINDYVNVAALAGSGLGEAARDGLNESIMSVKDFIEGKVSSQPTIRPVLDLSDVESGARRINGIFSHDQALALAGGGTIGGQNGNGSMVINMTVNGAPGQDVRQLADLVSERINNSIKRRDNRWR